MSAARARASAGVCGTPASIADDPDGGALFPAADPVAERRGAQAAGAGRRRVRSRTGLKVEGALDPRTCERGVEVSDAVTAAALLSRHSHDDVRMRAPEGRQIETGVYHSRHGNIVR